MIFRYIKLTLLLFIIFTKLFSQEIYSGKIIDAKTNELIQYVNIYVKNTQIGTVSNIEGRFDLIIPEIYKNDTLVFSFMGYHQYESIVSGFQKNQTIKLVPFVNEIEGVWVEEKRTRPIDILIKARENLKENRVDSVYETKVFSRNFVKKNNKFVSYRRTITEVLPENGRLWNRRGNIIADQYLTYAEWFNDLDKYEIDTYSLFSIPIATERGVLGNKSRKFLKNYIVNLDTVIFSERSKIYVIDVFRKDNDRKTIYSIYRLLSKNLSPYNMIFDKELQETAKEIIENKIYFTRYYIDAKQNYNVTNMLTLSVSFISNGFFKRENTFHYDYYSYTNTPGNSKINHIITFNETVNEIENAKPIYLKSVFEAFCYDDTDDFDESKYSSSPTDIVFFKYGRGDKRKSYDNWGNNSSYIKTDSLEEKAIAQIKDPTIEYIEDYSHELNGNNQNTNKNQRDFNSLPKVFIQFSGVIIDSLTNEPLEYCNILFENLDDSTKTVGAMTNEQGYFKIDIPYGYHYVMNYSYLGYKTKLDTVDIYTEDDDFSDLQGVSELIKADIGTIKLQPQENTLQTVTISESSKKIDLDKQSVIVTDKMKENTIAAKDLLNKVDGVKYNIATNEVKVDNDNKVKILVDGVERSEDYILNINPKRIKKIEILRNISGIYEIEGFKSIVNIITYDNYRGYDIKLSGNHLNNFEIKEVPKFMQSQASLSYNYTRNKLSFYTRASLNNNETENKYRTVTDFENTNNSIINSGTGTNIRKRYSTLFGVDYRINNKQIISCELSLKGFPASSNNTSLSQDSIITGIERDYLQSNMSSESEYYDMSGNAFYKYDINPGTKLTSYLYFSNKQLQYNQEVNNTNISNNNRSYSNLKYNIEFEKFFKKRYTLSSGAGYVNYNYISVDKNNIQSDFKNSFYKLRLYTYLNIKFTDNNSLLLGSSFEYYNTENNTTGADFNTIQPKLSFNQKLNKNNKLSLNYRLQSEYPYLSDLDPQGRYITPYLVMKGNPWLNPYLHHNISGQYQYQKDKTLNYFSFKPYYTFSDNSLGILPSTNDSLITYQKANFVKHERYGMLSQVSFEVKEKLSLDLSIDVFKDWNKNLTTPEIVDWTGSAELSYNASAKQFLGLVYEKNSSRNVTSLGYRQNNENNLILYWMTLQMKGRLQMMLGYFFPVSKNKNDIDYENTDFYTKTNYTDISQMNNMVMIFINYRFSKGRVQKTNKKINIEKFDKNDFNEKKLPTL